MYRLNNASFYQIVNGKLLFVHLMISFIILLIFWGCAKMFSDRVDIIRPITIRIQEKDTGNPIKNVIVYYLIRSSRLDKAFWIIPTIDPVHFEKKYMDRFMADENGVINISGIKVNFGQHEKLYNELICINLDIKNSEFDGGSLPLSFFKYFNIHDVANVDKFFNPVNQYKGSVIYNSANPSKVDKSDTKRNKFDIVWNIEGLLKKKEIMTVELEKW